MALTHGCTPGPVREAVSQAQGPQTTFPILYLPPGQPRAQCWGKCRAQVCGREGFCCAWLQSGARLLAFTAEMLERRWKHRWGGGSVAPLRASVQRRRCLQHCPGQGGFEKLLVPAPSAHRWGFKSLMPRSTRKMGLPKPEGRTGCGIPAPGAKLGAGRSKLQETELQTGANHRSRSSKPSCQERSSRAHRGKAILPPSPC